MEEMEPRAKSPAGLNRPLDSLSVDELEVYAQELEAELARVRAEQERKRSYRAGLDTFFKG